MEPRNHKEDGIAVYEIVQTEKISVMDRDFEVSNRVCITSVEAEAERFLRHHTHCKIIVHRYYPYQVLPKKR